MGVFYALRARAGLYKRKERDLTLEYWDFLLTL